MLVERALSHVISDNSNDRVARVDDDYEDDKEEVREEGLLMGSL
jgi:hypothetical protein